jgi:hypothetical protein
MSPASAMVACRRGTTCACPHTDAGRACLSAGCDAPLADRCPNSRAASLMRLRFDGFEI